MSGGVDTGGTGLRAGADEYIAAINARVPEDRPNRDFAWMLGLALLPLVCVALGFCAALLWKGCVC